MIDGEVWREQKRLLVKVFREHGLGKSGSEGRIIEEARHLLQVSIVLRDVNFEILADIVTQHVFSYRFMSSKFRQKDEFWWFFNISDQATIDKENIFSHMYNIFYVFALIQPVTMLVLTYYFFYKMPRQEQRDKTIRSLWIPSNKNLTKWVIKYLTPGLPSCPHRSVHQHNI